MNRIEQTFDRLNREGRKALVPFVTCGDPSLEATLATMHAMVESGADILELGVPFSDPMADGPVIQLANERSLAAGTRLIDVLETVARFRQTNPSTPVVLMGYMNPIEYMGHETFAENCARVGVDGLIIVDLPPEEIGDFDQLLKDRDIAPIYLLTPTTSDDRARAILKSCRGYIYYVSLKGVTGSNQLNVQDVAVQLQRLRKMTELPIAVGFGIRDAETAADVSRVADAVVVGSRLVNQMAEMQNEPVDAIATSVASIIKAMRQSMDQA